MRSWRRRLDVLAVPVIGLLLLAPIVGLGVLALGGERMVAVRDRPVHIESHDARPWLLLALLAALAALAGWARSERLRRQVDAVQADRRHEREEHERYARAWEREREYNRQLRAKVSELQRRHGLLGHADPREAILELSVELVEAEKGMLLTRGEGEGEPMRVACALGFDHDPTESAVAQRLARQVIDRDQTIREDREAQTPHGTPADDEIHNLLALPIYLHDDFHGVIVCANRRGGFAGLDDQVLLAVGDHAGAMLENTHLHGQLRSAYLQTVRTLSSVIEVKDPDLRSHSEAVATYVSAVAEGLGLEPRDREALVFGGLLHDVGKIGISERILLKPGPLTREEFSVMQLHPRIGYHLIRQIPALEAMALPILHHHERFDGEGYPGGLRGTAIPIESRIIAVADAFSAMITDRPYRKAESPEAACAELERCAGTQFDPEVVARFVVEVRRRPPETLAADPLPPDPELELHREPGSPVLGGSSFGIVDSLTLLHSHRHFYETARAEAARASVQGRPYAVIIARLDALPEINTRDGYAAGDAALQALADVFARAAGRVEGQAFRVSGCRVGLLVPGMDLQAAEALAGRIAQELAGGPSGTFGVAAWQPGESAEQTVERARRATEPSAGPISSST